MFNLIMTSDEWELAGRVSISRGRIFEHTESNIKEQHVTDEGKINIEKLKLLPTLFMNEGTGNELAYIGKINDVREVGSDILIDYYIDPNIPALKNDFFYSKRAEIGVFDRFEFSRNHWAVKDADLYLFLLRNIQQRRQRPAVFNLPEHESIDENLVSAMMPFSGGFDAVHESIKDSCESFGLTCNRADDIWENPSIIQDVVSLIDRSRIVICDCTGRNPNVFYEIGIAHTLGREVILITQNGDDVPFDLRHLRYIPYLNNAEGRSQLEQGLNDRIGTLIGH